MLGDGGVPTQAGLWTVGRRGGNRDGRGNAWTVRALDPHLRVFADGLRRLVGDRSYEKVGQAISWSTSAVANSCRGEKLASRSLVVAIAKECGQVSGLGPVAFLNRLEDPASQPPYLFLGRPVGCGNRVRRPDLRLRGWSMVG